VVDDGAVNAVNTQGSSLLAKGVIRVQGEFSRGEVAQVTNSKGKVIARGIASYSSQDLAKIAGKHSKDIGGILGYDYGSEVIHRDDLVVILE
jgi:glutamate 5-kinase